MEEIVWWFQRYLSDVGVGSCDDDVFLMLMMRFLEQSQLSASYRQPVSRIVGLREGIFSKILYKFKRSFAIKKGSSNSCAFASTDTQTHLFTMFLQIPYSTLSTTILMRILSTADRSSSPSASVNPEACFA